MSKHEVIFRGGIGNQLFCLFYAYKISRIYNVEVSLNLQNYYINEIKEREFLLQNLCPEFINEFKINNGLFSYLRFIFSLFLEKFLISNKTNRLPGDNPLIIRYWPNRYTHSGYFQKINNTKYNNECLEKIKDKFSNYLSKDKLNYLAIHIRRGDYLSKKHSIHGVVPEEYLVSESKKLLTTTNFDGITIFSDSPNLIDIKVFRSLHHNIIIDKGGNPVKVFKRMSSHKGLIASNSSFSLWAGILGEIKYFSIPSIWMKDVNSSVLGLKNIIRYPCLLV